MLAILNIVKAISKCESKVHYHKYYNSLSRRYSSNNNYQNVKTRSTLYYITAAGVLTVGLSYAAVPLYRMFCQSYSYGGSVSLGHDTSKVETMKAIKQRPLKIKFNADTASSMRWNFKPQQNEITVRLHNIIINFTVVY